MSLSLSGCAEHYRIGERVKVKWCDGEYPAFIIVKKSADRYRVHWEGYESRWDSDIALKQIVQKLPEPMSITPPMCPRVARALGLHKNGAQSVGQYKVGGHVKVTWRGSVYKATVLEVLGSDRFKVHYQGHESAWDEVVPSTRIVGAGK